MRSVILRLSLFLILFSLILTACQGEPVPPVPTQVEEPGTEATEEITFTLPDPGSVPEAYPIPQEGANDVSPIEKIYVPYPVPLEGEPIEWGEVADYIKSGQVLAVYQAQSREISLTLEDGRVLITNSPEWNAVFELIDECGEPCLGIAKISE